jgi:hypothetical protein
MSNAEPARHALYAELERVLGVDHAETLMTHLPQHTSDGAATKSDIALLDARFDRMEDRMDKMQRNFITVSFGTLTVMTAIFALITRI